MSGEVGDARKRLAQWSPSRPTTADDALWDELIDLRASVARVRAACDADPSGWGLVRSRDILAALDGPR